MHEQACAYPKGLVYETAAHRDIDTAVADADTNADATSPSRPSARPELMSY